MPTRPALPRLPADPLGSARRLAGRAVRRLRDLARGETDETFFDLHALRRLNPVLEAGGAAPLALDPAEADAGPAGAKRFVLALLASTPRLRRRFPTALSAGPDGPFARLLQEFGLPPAAAANVRAAFDSRPGEGGQRIYEIRADIRDIFPLGPTPPQRSRFLDWFLAHGTHETGLSVEDGLWWLFEVDERPDRGLLGLYLSQPRWQAAVPHGATVFGWPALVTFLRREYGAAGRWLRRARWRPVFRPWDDLTLLRRAEPKLAASFPAGGDADAVLAWIDRQRHLPRPPAGWRTGLREDFAAGLPAAPGANVLAHFRYTSGLQEAAVGVVRGLERCGVRTSRRDLPVLFDCDRRDQERYQGTELFDTTVYVAAANTFPSDWYPRAGLLRRPGVRRIAVWYWELEQVPAEWVPRLGWADEVWAPTRFIADAFRKVVSVPVVPMLPGLEVPAFAPKPRSHFGLPDDRTLFLFSFDMSSLLTRKNPLAVVAAFRRAFRPDDRAHLAIKVSRGKADPAGLAALTAACRDAGATLIDALLTREDTLALLASADCYVSLHRSEGLGLGMAEMMRLGKPVIATGYSGNLDFMTAETAYLVDYERVPIVEDLFPYPKGCLWADPSVGHAAELMRRVYERPDEAAAVGEQAGRYVAALMSPEAAGRRMADRLAAPERGFRP